MLILATNILSNMNQWFYAIGEIIYSKQHLKYAKDNNGMLKPELTLPFRNTLKWLSIKQQFLLLRPWKWER
jgi:hypothetical protein